MTRARMIASAAALLMLACCARKVEEPALIAGNDAAALLGNTASSAGDPALTAALHDQIMVDPALVQQANDDAIRPPTMPESGAVPPDGIASAAMTRRTDAEKAGGAPLRTAPAPSGDCPQCRIARQSLTLGALAEKQGGHTGECATNVTYSAAWANRLPRGVPLYPDARVVEAAGADGPGCALRVVSFASSAPLQRLLDWYFTRATEAGYRAGHRADGREHVLAGNRTAGGAFMIVMRARGDGGTDVDLMADGG